MRDAERAARGERRLETAEVLWHGEFPPAGDSDSEGRDRTAATDSGSDAMAGNKRGRIGRVMK